MKMIHYCFVFFSMLAIITLQSARGDYFTVTPPCQLEFPKDHGAHPGYKTEWWYYTGNVATATKDRFGYQLTFFRSQISPPESAKSWPHPTSAWRTRQIYMGHLALTDINNNAYYMDQDLGRGALNIAGAVTDQAATHVFLKNWSLIIQENRHILKAITPEFGIDLILSPSKPPIPHGISGYSQKGEKPESASCYYSFTRLQTRGNIEIGKQTFQAAGLSWMDHEFSSAPLEKNIEGWDWFSIQFDNQTELMIYYLRKNDKTFSPASSGTFIDSDGKSHRLNIDDIRLKITRYWKSPHTAARYPAGWKITIPKHHIDAEIAPKVSDQEMRGSDNSGIAYWEGSISVSGSIAGKSVEGFGYVELTGYEKPFDAPM